MDIIQNVIYYFSAIPLEYQIATSVGIGIFLYACYYAIAQYRYLQNKKFNRAKLKHIAGAPLSVADRKLLSKINKYPGCRPALGPFAQRAKAVKTAIKTRWHNILTSVQTDYNPWFLQDKITRLQRENNSISTDKWTYYHKVNELETQLDKYLVGIVDEPEIVQPLTDCERETVKSKVERFGGGFGTQSEFA